MSIIGSLCTAPLHFSKGRFSLQQRRLTTRELAGNIKLMQLQAVVSERWPTTRKARQASSRDVGGGRMRELFSPPTAASKLPLIEAQGNPLIFCPVDLLYRSSIRSLSFEHKAHATNHRRHKRRSLSKESQIAHKTTHVQTNKHTNIHECGNKTVELGQSMNINSYRARLWRQVFLSVCVRWRVYV